MVLQELIFTVSTLGGLVVLTELICNSFYAWEGVVSSEITDF